VLAVGGSWMVKADLLRAADWKTVTLLTAAAVETVGVAGRDR
jgi:2-keto-3-deoxy-6-phosphogluconate aldolase